MRNKRNALKIVKWKENRPSFVKNRIYLKKVCNKKWFLNSFVLKNKINFIVFVSFNVFIKKKCENA